MASLTDVEISMQIAQTYLYKIVCPITMVIGTISCIMNLLVFTQKTLRKNPCSIYFIAYNLANFFFIFTLYLTLTLTLGYGIDESSKNISICRLNLYSGVLLNCLSPFYLILASIDRIFVTSPNARTRQRSNIRFACLSIVIGTLFWALFHIPAIIFATHLRLAPNYFVCYFPLGAYLSFIGYYSLLQGIVSISLMIILGLWAIKNVRHVGRVGITLHTQETQISTTNHSRSNQSKDRQLMLMLRLDVVIYASFSFLYAIFLLYQQITTHKIKSDAEKNIEVIVSTFCSYLIGIPYCTSFYVNLFISKTFRKEAIKVLSWKRLFCIE